MTNAIKNKLRFFSVLIISFFLLLNCQTNSSSNSGTYVKANSEIEAGKYLVIVGGCNDCHTEDYAMKEGDVPEEDWLTGSVIGNRGPWGTTYASNLRLFVNDMDEDDWVETLKTRKSMPPMPWMNVNKMSEKDSKAMFKYIKSLGAKGEEMPRNVPPDQEPKTPYVSFVPQNVEMNH